MSRISQPVTKIGARFQNALDYGKREWFCYGVLLCLGITVTVCLAPLLAMAEIPLSSPGLPSSEVAKDGALVEPWGSVRIDILTPSPAKQIDQHLEKAPMPVAVTRIQAGSVALTQSAYRAPVWPSGVDVLESVVANTGEKVAQVRLELCVPEDMRIGETTGSIQGRPVLVLPVPLEPIRQQREWGCVGGVKAMPEWAKPTIDCDPAFRNIAAGMGGVPIKYRFTVPAGGERTVMLGFCESFHPASGIRPMVALVEGAEKRSIDPVQAWGQHVPGVVRFDATDADRDGQLEVTVAPHPEASDRNPILNAIWVFEPSTPIDEKQLIAGRFNHRAVRYVDVGGENDQGLYKSGNVKYEMTLQPGEQREFLLLAASPGCRSVANPSSDLWNKRTLREAAADVWRDRWRETSENSKEKPQ